MAKKIIVTYEKMTKPALIALVKKLQKRVDKLEGQLARYLHTPASQELIDSEDHGVVHVTQDDVPAPAFPWDVK